MGDAYDHLFKILLVGDSGVGKSCLLMRFTADRFDDVTTSTIGASCSWALKSRSGAQTVARSARSAPPALVAPPTRAVVARALAQPDSHRNPPKPKPKTGVDFRVKYVTLGGRRVKLTVWDTAGQERFRTLTSSYYRGAQGIVFAYDVTRRDTFENVERIWMKEVELYSNVEDAVKMVVANKVDLVGGAGAEGSAEGAEAAASAASASAREVSSEEGHALARANGCLFVETSAKANIAVSQAFEELVLKILETPGLVDAAGGGGGLASSPGGPGVRVGGAGPASASTGQCSC
jgi:Ras-related protein Rab-18